MDDFARTPAAICQDCCSNKHGEHTDREANPHDLFHQYRFNEGVSGQRHACPACENQYPAQGGQLPAGAHYGDTHEHHAGCHQRFGNGAEHFVTGGKHRQNGVERGLELTGLQRDEADCGHGENHRQRKHDLRRQQHQAGDHHHRQHCHSQHDAAIQCLSIGVVIKRGPLPEPDARYPDLGQLESHREAGLRWHCERKCVAIRDVQTAQRNASR